MSNTATPQTPTTKTTIYELRIVSTVDSQSDEHLQSEQAIRDEASSWLESLNGTVERVSLGKA